MEKLKMSKKDLKLKIFLEQQFPRHGTGTAETIHHLINLLEQKTILKRPPFKKRKLEEVFCYLQHTMKVQQLSTVDDLLDYFEEFAIRNKRLLEKYQQAPLLEKLELEKGFEQVYAVDPTSEESERGKRSFFAKTTDPGPGSARVPLLQHAKGTKVGTPDRVLSRKPRTKNKSNKKEVVS